MRRTIERLRTKPDHHKKRVAFGVACAVTAMIAGVWFSTQTFFSGPTVIAQTKTAGPLDAFAQSVASAWSGVANIFK